MHWQPYIAKHGPTQKPSGLSRAAILTPPLCLVSGRTVHLGGATGRVYVQRMLARGAYGTVYAVHAPRYRGAHVLKCVDLRLQARNIVAREVALQRLAAGPYVIAAHAPTFAQHQAYFLLERGDGGTVEQALSHNLARGKPTDIDLILRWFTHMMQAVTQCHARSIIHRDIKPDNFVLVGGEGGGHQGQVKLTDFGLATAVAEASHAVGTLTYMAPEVLRGHGAAAAADLWSLGTTLYRMIVGIEPFYDDTPEAIAQRLLRNEPQFTRVDLAHTLLNRHVRAPLCQAIVQAITGMLQADPKARLTLQGLNTSALGPYLTPYRVP